MRGFQLFQGGKPKCLFRSGFPARGGGRAVLRNTPVKRARQDWARREARPGCPGGTLNSADRAVSDRDGVLRFWFLLSLQWLVPGRHLTSDTGLPGLT